MDSINFFEERDSDKVRQHASDHISNIQQQNKINYDSKYKSPISSVNKKLVPI